MIRPLYRWKSFWFGVLVIAFLGWAWVRSLQYLEGVVWLAGAATVSASQTTGIVELSWDSTPTPPGLEELFWFHERAMKGSEPRFSKAVNWETYSHQIQFTIAHWFLILLFLVPWSGWLAWRWRKVRKLAVSL